MKKTVAFILTLTAILSFSACDDHAKNTENTESAVSVQNENSDDTASEDDGSGSSSDESESTLPMKNFGELWMGDAYYIDVLMTQEFDESKLSSAAASSEGSQASKTKTVNYDYIIAVDFENDIGGLSMLSDLGSQSTLVKDHYIYEINHGDKTYTKKLYDGNAEDFGAEFTVKICLGIINNCVFVESGKTKFQDQDVKYEKYTVESQLKGIKDPEITYYFDYADKPVAEVVETDSGKTTFTFRKVSSNIEVKDILNIPSGYKEVQETSKVQ